MSLRFLVALTALCLSTACSLVMDFNPSGQPCSSGGACLSGFACVEGTCRPAPCDPACGSDEECVAGTCRKLDCQNADCGEGAACDQGVCTALDCVGLSCNDGTLCVDGACLPTLCDGRRCDANQVCVNGACSDLRCQGVTCAQGQTCAGAKCVACAAKETSCKDGLDDDCDGDVDCADIDCWGQVCSDGNLCTQGETCAQDGRCQGGGPVTCGAAGADSCWEAQGACEEAFGCVYPPRASGSACNDKNPCTVTDACDGRGVCASTIKVCDTPPGPCFEPIGQCNAANGTCVYAPKPGQTPCDDQNACTTSDVCNGEGACKGLPLACPAGPCETASCLAGVCKKTPKADGDKCGTLRGERCCGNACVNISNNAKNCGGCGKACATGRSCEPITSRPCSASAGAISGRCTCAGLDSECALSGINQLCRSCNFPECNICVPAGCAPGMSVVVPRNNLDQCAPYCAYD